MAHDHAGDCPLDRFWTGHCHVCKLRKRTLYYCTDCDHWFCRMCRRKYFHRGMGYVKQIIGGRKHECCFGEHLTEGTVGEEDLDA